MRDVAVSEEDFFVKVIAGDEGDGTALELRIEMADQADLVVDAVGNVSQDGCPGFLRVSFCDQELDSRHGVFFSVFQL